MFKEDSCRKNCSKEKYTISNLNYSLENKI